MKKSIAKSILPVAIAFLFIACNNDKTYNTYFYTSIDTSEVKLNLFIDDVDKGLLPYHNSELTCASDSLVQKTIFTQLECGKYIIESKDASGNLQTSSDIKLKSNGLSSDSNKAGIKLRPNDDCLVIEVYN